MKSNLKSIQPQPLVSALLVVGAIVLSTITFQLRGFIQIDLVKGQILIDGRSSEK